MSYHLTLSVMLALTVAGNLQAQERTAAGVLDTQMMWTALSSAVSAANTKSDAVNVRVNQIVVCGRKGMVYAPGSTGANPADGDGCVQAQPSTAVTNFMNNTNQTVTNIRNCGASGQTFNGSSCVATAPSCRLQVTTYNSCGNRNNPSLPAGSVLISSVPTYCGSQGDTSGSERTWGAVVCN